MRVRSSRIRDKITPFATWTGVGDAAVFCTAVEPVFSSAAPGVRGEASGNTTGGAQGKAGTRFGELSVGGLARPHFGARDTCAPRSRSLADHWTR